MTAEGLADLGAYLLAPDHGALDLLHALSWDSMLATLAPAVRPGAKLDDRAQQWATQLTLLALQCMVLLPHAQLPAWLQSLSQPLGKHSLKFWHLTEVPKPKPKLYGETETCDYARQVLSRK